MDFQKLKIFIDFIKELKFSVYINHLMEKWKFYYNWRIAPDEKTKTLYKRIYIQEKIHSNMLKQFDMMYKDKNMKQDPTKEVNWYAGIIPDDWEEKANLVISKTKEVNKKA